MKLKFIYVLIAMLFITPALAADNIDSFTDRLAAAKDTTEKAEIYMEIGHSYVGKGLYDKAAEAYLKALPVIRKSLNDDDLTDIAINISWGGKLKEAMDELRFVLQRNPAYTRARVQLARVLLWSDDPTGALSEVESVLAKQPDDRNAMMVKAEALRSNGEVDRSIVIYKLLLEHSDDFDTRIGLSNAYLDKGDLDSAQAALPLIRPVYPYQQLELEKLNSRIANVRQQPKPPVAGKADILKSEGDQFARQKEFTAAAVKYKEALMLSHNFPPDELTQMATVISWSGDHQSAKRELEAVLAREPSNIPARVQLGRVLTWMGEFDASIREAEKVLAVKPDHHDALLVKANALRLKGFYRSADRIFNGLLLLAEDFDVREGLTYSYLTSGNRLKTDENLALMKPAYDYQRKSLSELEMDRDWAFRPRLYAGTSYYYDHDDNRVANYSIGTQAYLWNWRTNLDYQYTRATAPDQAAGGDSLQLSTYSRMPWYGGIGAGAGFAGGSIFTWNAHADLDILYGSASLSVAREAYMYTAELINNNINDLALSAWALQRPTDRITLQGGYTYRDYSDSNGSHDAQASIAYLFFRKPATAVGYRFHYMNFRRQSGGGYFDPNDYVGDSVFVNLSFDANRWYGYIEPYGGYETYQRNDASKYGFFCGGSGLLGYKATNKMAIEGTAEAGNSASGVTFGGESGWYYYQLGIRVILSF